MIRHCDCAFGYNSRDVDRREGPLVLNLAVQKQFGIAGALELFEGHFVDAAAGINQRGRDDGERTALLDVARGAEVTLTLRANRLQRRSCPR